jgi:STAND-like protein
MDPLSITAGALACLTAIVQTSKAITNFIRGCREARGDLTVISRELSDLGIVLELLKDDTDVADDRVIPEPIQRQILSILANCKDVIGKVDDLLAHHAGKRGAVLWAMGGKKDATNLRQSLEAHRGALGLALETVTL